ncbi:Fatty-acid amide hydrolase 2 [Nymphon striatum]|nr:Fatty-acid amide hydrolase 2 [Nymphon striatum]
MSLITLAQNVFSGLVLNGGQFPEAISCAADILVTGPLCRFTSDLLPMLMCLSGSNLPRKILDTHVNNSDVDYEPMESDNETIDSYESDDVLSEHEDDGVMLFDVDLKKLKIYYMEDDGGIPVTTNVTPELREAQQKVLTHFETEHNIRCEKVNFTKIIHIMNMWSTQMSYKDIPKFSEEMTGRNGKLNSWMELAKWLTNRMGNFRSHYVNMLDEFKKEFNEMLGDNGIFLYPSHPKVAPYHNQPIAMPFNFLYTALFNALQAPVTQCPLGLDSSGLPLGIQVVASPSNDHLTLAVASELERVFGGWVCPSAAVL